MTNKIISFLTLILFLSASYSSAQQRPDFVPFINQQHHWVDSVFNSLTPEERIAQLFLVRAHTNLGSGYIDSVAKVIEKEQLGGLVLFQGGAMKHAAMINRYQSLVKVPLLNTIDAEWGLGMRLPDSTISYPYQMTLGAIQDNHWIYEMGKEIGKDLKRMGVHFNFAPVVDINNNQKNPVIGFRSFGDDKVKVTEKAEAYMRGLMDEGIIASLKHFPGHGDTDVDSHHDLPQLNFTKERLENLELYPFRKLMAKNTPAIMVAHMNIPALDETPNMPSSISKKVVTDLLKVEMGFKGLVVTDAMDMNGVKKFFPNGEADVMAIEAGHDLLEISENSGRAIRLIQEAVESGRIAKEDLDARVKKVLATKYWLGLNTYRPAELTGLYEDLNRKSSKELVDVLAEKSVTVLKSHKGLDRLQFSVNTAIVSIGVPELQEFEKKLKQEFTDVHEYMITGTEDKEQINKLVKAIRNHKQIILAIHDNRARPRATLDLSDSLLQFVDKLAGRRTVTVLFTSPYVIDQLAVGRSASLVVGYQNDDFMQRAAAKVLLREVKASGKLPVTVNRKFKNGQGL